MGRIIAIDYGNRRVGLAVSDEGRIIAIGYGPDRPAASNDTELNRAKNRRVEMRLKKL